MSTQTKKLIILAGPTAIGKTALAIQLARHFQTEIFSADSRQIYKEMTIGTAKPSPEELELAKHHMINIVSIHDEWDVFQYEHRVIQKLERYFESNNIAILVGGTGLYIKAVLEGLHAFPTVESEVLHKLENQFADEGLGALTAILKEADPEYHQIADLKNHRRVIRALSVIQSSGQKFSHFLQQDRPARSFTTTNITLVCDRSILYERINSRVDQMIEHGLLAEVNQLQEYKDLKSLQTIGYKEIFNYLDGETDLNYAIDKIKQHTRNYAKRQITWFSNNYDGLDSVSYTHLTLPTICSV